ncbi:hypothetical protein S40288_01016 [Stachybotrys chartarum IBT 40288]|nr:hypothetical protein S40288_01016 [Stachybotrys chartarum IBT 40288]
MICPSACSSSLSFLAKSILYHSSLSPIQPPYQFCFPPLRSEALLSSALPFTLRLATGRMDRAKADLGPKSEHDKFFHIAYKDRWTSLKPVIIQLWTGDYGSRGRPTATMDELVEFMKTNYGFHATAPQYRNHFQKWGTSKNANHIETTKALGKRKRPGTSTSLVTIEKNGKSAPLEPKKLARYLKSRAADTPVEPLTPGILSSWNLPYKALLSSLPQDPGQPSPFGPLGTTPEYLNIRSPEAITPGRMDAGPSPNMELVYKHTREQQTSLFLQGRLNELLVSMHSDQRWHCYRTAKSWSSFPPTTGQARGSIQTPGAEGSPDTGTLSTSLDTSSSPQAFTSSRGKRASSPPTQLCRWSIHVRKEVTLFREEQVNDMSASESSPFVESLRESIVNNEFTSTPPADVPIAKDMIVESLQKDQAALQLDAWKVAIISGNRDLLEHLDEENGLETPRGLESIHPVHLAASHLDGGHTCCDMITGLLTILGSDYPRHHYIDDLGHSILDVLMVSILRSHTTIQPSTVSYGYHSSNMFPGEHHDICGRWDPETPKVRLLLEAGYCRIPTKWKHMFCHTAVQAVCHTIILIFAGPSSPDINTKSGLFLGRCTACGLELKLGPIHTLVVVTFYLAQRGMDGETLFGTLAVLVSLLVLGVDATCTANVSAEELLGVAAAGTCHHALISPLQLMQAVPENIVQSWTEACQTGWACFYQVLSLVETSEDWKPAQDGKESTIETNSEASSDQSIEDSEERESHPRSMYHCYIEAELGTHSAFLKIPCNGPKLGLLWATIQTELLTYRKIEVEDSWISNNFSMDRLRDWLDGLTSELLIPLVQQRMMKHHAGCGWFIGDYDDFFLPSAPEVCATYFMNMDIHARTRFLRGTDIYSDWCQFD